jgi:hypothetical protein
MKNIHILPTDKPRFGKYLVLNKESKLCIWDTNFMGSQTTLPAQNIYITSDEDAKKTEYYYLPANNTIQKSDNDNECRYYGGKKIILTTDQSLDGIQAIDDEFLEWFVNNPSCEEVEVRYTVDFNSKAVIIIPKEEPKQETLEEVECNNCGYLMSLTEDESVYVCYNSECTSCYEEYEKEPKQENCCTPVGQIKRYIDCVGCDRKPKQIDMSKYTIGIDPYDTQETTLEEAAEKYVEQITTKEFGKPHNAPHRVKTFIEGAKWHSEQSQEAINKLISIIEWYDNESDVRPDAETFMWFEQFKKK